MFYLAVSPAAARMVTGRVAARFLTLSQRQQKGLKLSADYKSAASQKAVRLFELNIN